MHSKHRTIKFLALALAIWLLDVVFMIVGLHIGEIEHADIWRILLSVGSDICIAGLFLLAMYKSKLPQK